MSSTGRKAKKPWNGDVNEWGPYQSVQKRNSTVQYGSGTNVDYAKKTKSGAEPTPVFVAAFNEKQRNYTQNKQLKGISRSLF
jgi:hypothetical protein